MPTIAEIIAAEDARRAAANAAPPPAGAETPPPAGSAQDAIAAEDARRKPGQVEDILRSSGAGLRAGLEGIPGMGGDIAGLGRLGAAKLAQYLGADPETVKQITEYDIPVLPDISSATIHDWTAKNTPLGESYEPQTTAGKFARTGVEFGTGFVSPGGGLAKAGKKIAEGIGAGIASETAGQLAEGTGYEGAARLAAGIAGGAAPSAIDAGRAAVKNRPGQMAEIASEDAAREHGVNLTQGERTGNIDQQSNEQAMLHGGRGSWAQELMANRRRENLQAVKDASAGFMDQTAPARGATPVDSAGILNLNTRTRAEELLSRGGKGIEEAVNSGVMFDADRLRGLPDELNAGIRGDKPYVPKITLGERTPASNQAMELVQNFIKQAEDPNVKEIGIAGVEDLRQTLNTLDPAPGSYDARAFKEVRDHFDNWYDDSIKNDARVMPDPNALPNGSADPRDVLSNLIASRKTYREGKEITDPRNKPVGGKEVAKIAAEGTHPEDTSRLFKPSDRGDISGSAIDAIDRLKKTGSPRGDLDQVRHMVLDQLTTGDPGKVASRIENFIRDNPTAAKGLFSEDELKSLSGLGGTNKKLVPNPLATNPSKSGFTILRDKAKGAAKDAVTKGGLLGSVIGGPLGGAVGAVGGGALSLAETYMSGNAAKKALAPVDRRTPNQFAIEGAVKGPGKLGSIRAGQTMTIDDPGGEGDGQRGVIVEIGDNMVKLRMPNGKIKQVGKAMVQEAD